MKVYKKYRNIIAIIIIIVVSVVLYLEGKLCGAISKQSNFDTYETNEVVRCTSPVSYTPEILLSEKDMDAFAVFINKLWQVGENSHPELLPRLNFPAQAVYLSVRSEGKRLAEIWETDGNTGEALASAINKAKSQISESDLVSVDTLEICLGHSFKQYHLDQADSANSLFSNIHRGVWGLEIVYNNGSIIERYSPTYAICSNRDNSRLMELFREKYVLSEEDFLKNADIFAFQAEQVLVRLGEFPKAVLMERGNTYVNPSMVTRKNIKHLAHLAGKWMCNNVREDGRMTYKYWPSSATESKANNMIRQWMATVALIRYGISEGNQDILSLAENNIDYNIKHFYKEVDGFGLICYQDQVKLGALALAGLAILEHPEREKWKLQERALQKTIDSLWNEDGSITSFFIPEGDMRFQNFYPGEALLYWAALYEKERDPQLLQKIMKSFEYYRQWHLNPENRNPAFIPWHTQAYYIIWKITGHQPLKDFIFEMNDWLLPVQQVSDYPVYPDILGRFYDPDRPFGPPHSSSTGVYLEGLIDAFELAREVGDYDRMNNYRTAINWGLRSVIQLQFTDAIDMFYVSPSMKKYVEGGIRTTVYNNEIRCDNVQHNLMAALKILEVFDDADYNNYEV